MQVKLLRFNVRSTEKYDIIFLEKVKVKRIKQGKTRKEKKRKNKNRKQERKNE